MLLHTTEKIALIMPTTTFSTKSNLCLARSSCKVARALLQKTGERDNTMI